MSSNAPPRLFDRALVRQHRSRSACTLAEHDFLLKRAIEDIGDRLVTLTRDFGRALMLGGGGNGVALLKELAPEAFAKAGKELGVI